MTRVRSALAVVGSVAMLIACPKALDSEVAPAAVGAAPRAEPGDRRVAPAGVVQAGTFTDESYPLAISVPGSWRCVSGESNTPLRVALTHDPTQVRVEVRVEHAADAPRHSTPACAWRYEDVGAHKGLRVAGEVTVATCAPREPTAPRLFETRVTRSGLTYLFTVIVPAGQLMVSRPAVEEVLSGVRLR